MYVRHKLSSIISPVCEAHQDRELKEWHGQMRRILPSATRIESGAELDLWDFSVDAFLDGRISI